MIFSFYDPATGLLVGRKMRCSKLSDAEKNAPEGMAVILGDFDHRCQRVDINTGSVVDYQPQKPDDDHEWNESLRRWVPTPALLRKRAALEEIRRLERDQQPRALREATLGKGTDHLQRIEAKIESLRAVLTSPDDRPVDTSGD